MIRAPFAYRRTYPLPLGYSVEFVLDGQNLSANWAPRQPAKHAGRKLLPHYKAARNDFLASLGVPVMVIDL